MNPNGPWRYGPGQYGRGGWWLSAHRVPPDALLMDEPFSALDVLTAANLRGELTRLGPVRRAVRVRLRERGAGPGLGPG